MYVLYANFGTYHIPLFIKLSIFAFNATQSAEIIFTKRFMGIANTHIELKRNVKF